MRRTLNLGPRLALGGLKRHAHVQGDTGHQRVEQERRRDTVQLRRRQSQIRKFTKPFLHVRQHLPRFGIGEFQPDHARSNLEVGQGELRLGSVLERCAEQKEGPHGP